MSPSNPTQNGYNEFRSSWTNVCLLSLQHLVLLCNRSWSALDVAMEYGQELIFVINQYWVGFNSMSPSSISYDYLISIINSETHIWTPDDLFKVNVFEFGIKLSVAQALVGPTCRSLGWKPFIFSLKSLKPKQTWSRVLVKNLWKWLAYFFCVN